MPFNLPNILGSWNHEDSSERMTIENRTYSLFCVLCLHKGDETNFFFGQIPNLKRFVLPALCNLAKEAIEHAISLWEGFESIIITRMTNHDESFPAIGKYCKGITEFKITMGFEMDHARAFIEHTPNLKFLSIQSIIVNFRALCCVLENLKHLEIVNLCHSLIMDKPDPSTQLVLYTFCQLQNQWPIYRLRKVLFSLSKSVGGVKSDHPTKRNFQSKKTYCTKKEIKNRVTAAPTANPDGASRRPEARPPPRQHLQGGGHGSRNGDGSNGDGAPRRVSSDDNSSLTPPSHLSLSLLRAMVAVSSSTADDGDGMAASS
ncbi:hypothetical protein Ahy_B04g071825 [Arachis hypogaea]|uniref:Uncharacterized protein n=1 Tax=Arachis hypogaea TaxID=3818 RepID=A0A444ZLN9_ARAHY|nr:hypothetical protein Ahy_B04g071825 [Arachis hypogaea]